MWMCFSIYQYAENKELQDKILLLEQQLASLSDGKKTPVSGMCVSDECADELRKKVQSQVRCVIGPLLQSDTIYLLNLSECLSLIPLEQKSFLRLSLSFHLGHLSYLSNKG